jgi:ABC-2 type transport system ATP-binding protein
MNCKAGMRAIEIDNLYKSYDTLPVLRDLTLHLEEGEVYGLLGPNGSGKSTLLHLLLGFLRPDAGRLRVLGTSNPAQVIGRIGYLPERLRYHLRYTGREYLRYLGQFSGLDGPELEQRIDEELRAVELADAAGRMLSTFSRGMLQRLGVAQALLHQPVLLLFDEPTSGLDPGGQREMLELLSSLRTRGHTTLMATHYLDEAEQLCDRVGVLFEGRLAAEATAAELRVPGRSVQIDVADLPPEVAEQLQRLAPAVHCRGPAVLIEPNSPALQATVLRTLLDAAVSVVAVVPRSRPLEELYLRTIRGDLAAAVPETAAPAIASAAPGSARPGDTLLRELLRREDNRDNRGEGG